MWSTCNSAATRRPLLGTGRATYALKRRQRPCSHAAAEGGGTNGTSGTDGGASGAASPQQQDDARAYKFTYQGSDGRLKATFEQAFKGAYRGADAGDGGSESEAAAPWAVG